MRSFSLNAEMASNVSAIVFFLGMCACTSFPLTTSPRTSEVSDSTDDYNASIANIRNSASAEPTTLDDINSLLRPYDRIYRPTGTGQFPAMLFFHGCSGPTLSHEEDWARFYNGIGVVVVAVDSYSGRGIDWEKVCNLSSLTPWERAGDVLATLGYVRTLEFVDPNRIGLTGFSHGAGTVWTTLALASTKTPPINLEAWPDKGIDGVKLALPFYISCMERWTVPVHTISFLGEADRYIDESTCADYRKTNAEMTEFFSYHVFPEATHTFDHARPSPVNVESGSIYDPVATAETRRLIAEAIDEFLR